MCLAWARLLVLWVLLVFRAAAAPIQFCVLPPTRHLNFSLPCSAHTDVTSSNISWAAQRGEFESAQILVAPAADPGTLSITFSDLVAHSGAVLASSQLSWWQQGYVFVRHTSRYADSGCPDSINGSCWRPDPLLPPSGDNTIEVLADGRHQPLWVTVSVPRSAQPAAQGQEYRGSLTLSFQPSATKAGHKQRTTAHVVVPIQLEVWKITVPTTAQATVQHDWHFAASQVLPFYPDRPAYETAQQWWQFMEAHRLPPIDKDAWNCQPGSKSAVCTTASSGKSFLDGKTSMLEAGIAMNGCNCSSCPEQEAKRNAEAMRPVVEAAANVSNAKLFGYGFDERPRSCEKSIRTQFGAFLDEFPVEKYPQVGGTMAALNWAGSSGAHGPTGSHPSDGGMPLDMPFTAWVLQYQYYNETTANAWVNSSFKGRPRQLYLYHCIEPSEVDYLNIFIERPLIQARLLFWLGATQNIQGWLYWATDLWRNRPDSPYPWQRQNRTTMRRINGSMLTDFDPASIIWCSQKLYNFWVNGDGYYMYPGPHGPLSTSRLEAIRDALEDMELLRMVPSSVRRAAVYQLVRNATDHKDDPLLLEAVRRSIGRQAHTTSTEATGTY